MCAASGYVVHFFPTGQGNVIGNPILPVIKICANPRTVRTMSEHVDVDTSGLLQREITMDQAGDKLLEMMFRTANGRLTAAEALGHREFVMTRLVRKRLELDDRAADWRGMRGGIDATEQCDGSRTGGVADMRDKRRSTQVLRALTTVLFAGIAATQVRAAPR